MKLAVTALVMALAASSAMALTYNWNGSASDLWTTPANWTPIDGGTTYPQTTGDYAVFPATATVDLTGLTALPNVNITGTLTMNHPSGSISSPNNTAIVGTGKLIKTGAGTIRFNQGSMPNTFSGGLEIQQGKIMLSGGDEIVPAGGLTMTGGTLQLLEGNRINDNCPFTLAGGFINWSNLSDTVGTLALTGSVTMNDLNGNGIHFANSSAIDWSSGTALNIEILASDVSGAGIGSIYFGNSASGLTSAQLAKITFIELGGDWEPNGNTYAAGLDSTGKLIISAAPSHTYLSADFNKDLKVSFADYLILEQNFGKTQRDNSTGDANNDTKCSFADYLILEQQFGHTTTPEPATLGLLALGAIGLIRRKK